MPTRQAHAQVTSANLVAWVITVAITIGAALLIHWSGLVFNTVATSSMAPTYQPTDIVVTVGPNVHPPKIGDAIVFEADYVGQHIPGHVHRIVAQNSDGSWTTKGDANADPDGWRVQPADIRGTVIYAMPSAQLRSPILIGLFIFGVLVLAFWPTAKSSAGGRSAGRGSGGTSAAGAASGPKHGRKAAASRSHVS